MKTLAALLFTFMIIFGSTTASAGELSELESLLLQTYMTDESARSAAYATYWTDIGLRVIETQKDLPTRVHPAVILDTVVYDGKTGITYTYYVNTPNFDLDIVKKNLLGLLCNDPQVSLMIHTFGGKIDYIHFLVTDRTKIWDQFSIDATDCGTGIYP